MHVSSIEPGYRRTGNRYKVGARIAVQDANGAPVANATLYFEIILPNGYVKTNELRHTDANGQAISYFDTIFPGTYTYCITGLSLPGWTYDPSQNVETCDSVTVP